MQKQHPPDRSDGQRIRLETHRIENAEAMFESICGDRERLSKFLPWPDFIQAVEDEAAYIRKCQDAFENHSSASYSIFHSASNAFVGVVEAFLLDWVNESCEIGYWLLGTFEGKGYMREAVELLLSELKTLGFNRTVIMCEPGNARSCSIPQRLGFELEGTLRDYKKDRGQFHSFHVFSTLLQRQ